MLRQSNDKKMSVIKKANAVNGIRFFYNAHGWLINRLTLFFIFTGIVVGRRNF